MLSHAIYRILIHTPTKGATGNHYYRDGYYVGFQSTLPRRERPQFYLKIPLNFLIKSTKIYFYMMFFFSSFLPLYISQFFLCTFSVRIPRYFHVYFSFALNFTSYRLPFVTISMYHPQLFLYQRPYAPLLSDTYSPNNRISDCRHSHQ